jgi:hypothetical protein
MSTVFVREQMIKLALGWLVIGTMIHSLATIV